MRGVERASATWPTSSNTPTAQTHSRQSHWHRAPGAVGAPLCWCLHRNKKNIRSGERLTRVSVPEAQHRVVEDQQVSEPHRRTQVVQEVSQRIAELPGSGQGPLRVRHRKTTGHSSFAETELCGSLLLQRSWRELDSDEPGFTSPSSQR